MDILELLKADYDRFPEHQTYSLYAEDVYFADPLTQFQGLKRYQQMIDFIQRWFQKPSLVLHDLEQDGDRIHSRWTLSWTAPLPWRPRMVISGRSELMLNPEGLISSHIDYWDCSRWAVLQQLFRGHPQ